MSSTKPTGSILDTISCVKCGHEMHLEAAAGGYAPPGFEPEFDFYCTNCDHVESGEAVKRSIAGLRADMAKLAARAEVKP